MEELGGDTESNPRSQLHVEERVGSESEHEVWAAARRLDGLRIRVKASRSRRERAVNETELSRREKETLLGALLSC